MSPFVSYLIFRFGLVLGCLGIGLIRSEMPLLSKKVNTIIEEGKRQYNLAKAKTTIPSLGSCWKTAVTQLHNGCKHLDDSIQSDLALAFANCFLEGAGLSRYECDDTSLNDVCKRNMPDRAFLAYTEFFTHTQSMCFFIMSEVWHEETEETIDRLSLSAADVARQLEASEELQVELLNHQRQSVAIQQELLDNGYSLGHMLHESRDSLNLMFSEFRSSTLEQQRLLGVVFHHLSALQSWVVGEVSWLDSIAFYIPSFAVVFFLTSAQRSANARIPSNVMLILAALIERFIANILLHTDSDFSDLQPVEVINERLNWWVWLIRRSSVGVIFVFLAVSLYRYNNREEIMHQILQKIQNQNEELLKYITLQKTHTNINASKVDEPDGFGYIAIPTMLSSPSASQSHGSTRSNSSSSSSLYRQRLSSSPNGNSPSLLLEEVSIQDPLPSPFRPILRKSSKCNTRMSEEPRTIQNPEQDVDEYSSNSINLTSTPKRKADRKTMNDKSSTSPRYNLRRGRLLTPVS